jgi:hypothetical protein
MSTLDKLLDAVKSHMSNRTQEGDSKGGRGGLLGRLGDLLGQRKRAASAGPGRGPIRDVRPASEDPYGDPADEFRGRNVKPASEDPYGDPADEPRRR